MRASLQLMKEPAQRRGDLSANVIAQLRRPRYERHKDVSFSGLQRHCLLTFSLTLQNLARQIAELKRGRAEGPVAQLYKHDVSLPLILFDR